MYNHADLRACSSAVEQGTHNPLVVGSNPSGPNYLQKRAKNLALF